jgi:hypothetical protein
MPIRGMTDGLDAPNVGEGPGCLCFIPSEVGRKADEPARYVVRLVQLIATRGTPFD